MSVDCRHCGTPLVGDYCHACGQARIGPDDLRLGALVREFGHELAHLDFKTLRSLAAVLRPGYLTHRYLAGHRRPYTDPLKLYLLCAAFFFLAAPWAGFTLDALAGQDRSGALPGLVAERVAASGVPREWFAERFDLRLQTVYTLSLSISLATASLLLAVLFRRRALPFGAHIVFALHYVSFLYLLAIPLGMLNQVTRATVPMAALLLTYAILAPFLYVALRRVYGERGLRLAAKVAVMLAVAFVVDGLVGIGAILLTLRLV